MSLCRGLTHVCISSYQNIILYYLLSHWFYRAILTLICELDYKGFAWFCFPSVQKIILVNSKNLMSYCSGLTTCVFLISVLSVNRLSYLYLRSVFSHSCVRFKYQFYKHNICSLYIPTSTSLLPTFYVSAPHIYSPILLLHFPTGPIFITVGERKDFFHFILS
jgi:hypothetical protein